MDISDYQTVANETIQFDVKNRENVVIPLLGLSGETGELLTEFKKQIRDGDAYRVFRERVVEELGDILWYVSAVATVQDIDLSEVLEKNIKKITKRWKDKGDNSYLPGLEPELFDDGYPDNEQFPREFIIEFREIGSGGDCGVQVTVNGKEFADPLRDNHYDEDGYRFHDIFHFSYVTHFGWSPIVRKHLKLKRKSIKEIDEVEDGGRAAVIDEALSAYIFEYARKRSFLEGIATIDYELIRHIEALTAHLEIKSVTGRQWETAILDGFRIWRQIVANKGGRVICDLHNHSMIYEKL